MQVGKDWIEFSWKAPYSAISGKPLPEDFEVMVAYRIDTKFHYTIMTAIEATRRYQEQPTIFIAWKAFEEYVPNTKR